MTQEEIDNAIQWRNRWADNTDYMDEDSGMLYFSSIVFPDDNYQKRAQVHYKMYRNLLQIFNPRYRFLQERQIQFILYRGCSKSTVTNLFFMSYVICFNGFTIKIPDWDLKNDCLFSDKILEVPIDKAFIVLISETATIAETWVTRVKGELAKNDMIKKVFGNMKEQALQDDEGKWTKSGFSVIKDGLPNWQKGRNLTVVSKGSGMQLRGINIKGRPDLEIWDDLYSLSNTKTEESRHKVRYFATAEAKDGIDPNRGAIISLGTIVHEDTIPVDNKKSSYWYTIEQPVMDKVLFQEVINEHCKLDIDKGTFNKPDRWECKKLEELGYKTNWSDRITLEMLLAIFGEKVEARSAAMFWQEYFHEISPEEDRQIRPHMIQTRELTLIEKQIDNQWVSFVRYKDDEDREVYQNVKLGIGIDAATSYKTDADNSAIIYVAKDSYNRVYVLENKSGKFAFSDEIPLEYRAEYQMKLCLDRSKITRIGTADEMFRMVNGTHHRPLFVIETNNAGGELIKQVRNKMQNYGTMYQYTEVWQVRDKIERILDTLKPYYQSKAVTHNLNQGILIHELEYLGKTRFDDCADILACVVDKLQRPNVKIDFNQEKKEDDKYTPPKWLKNTSTYNRAAPDWVVA